MLSMFFALLGTGCILLVSEYLLRKKILHGEIARKFVHIVAGTFMASWAFFMSTGQIQVLSVILLAGVFISKFLKIFSSVHGVTRKTWGEAFFAISIGLTATLAPNEWIYAIAILHMSIADGLAAVIGTKFGKSSGYTVAGQHKTLVGTLTFYLISLMFTWLLVFVMPAGISQQAWSVVFWLPLLATFTENLAYKGLDNIAVPMVVIGVIYFVNQVYA